MPSNLLSLGVESLRVERVAVVLLGVVGLPTICLAKALVDAAIHVNGAAMVARSFPWLEGNGNGGVTNSPVTTPIGEPLHHGTLGQAIDPHNRHSIAWQTGPAGPWLVDCWGWLNGARLPIFQVFPVVDWVNANSPVRMAVAARLDDGQIGVGWCCLIAPRGIR